MTTAKELYSQANAAEEAGRYNDASRLFEQADDAVRQEHDDLLAGVGQLREYIDQLLSVCFPLGQYNQGKTYALTAVRTRLDQLMKGIE